MESSQIKKLKQKNLNAFKDLYDELAPQMKFLCLRYVKNKYEVEEIAQNAFLKLFKKIDHYKNQQPFEEWIKHVFIETSVNHVLQYRADEHQWEQDDFSAEPDEEQRADVKAEEKELKNVRQVVFNRDELLNMIFILPGEYRIIYNLYVIDHYDHEAISNLIGISSETSQSLLAQARMKLKKEIQKRTAFKIHETKMYNQS